MINSIGAETGTFNTIVIILLLAPFTIMKNLSVPFLKWLVTHQNEIKTFVSTGGFRAQLYDHIRKTCMSDGHLLYCH